MPSFGTSRLRSAAPSPVLPQLVATRGDMPHGGTTSMASNIGFPCRLQGQTRHNFGYRDIKWFALVFPGFGWQNAADSLLGYDTPIRAAVYIPSAPKSGPVRVTFEGGRKAIDAKDGTTVVDQGLIPSGAAEYISDRLTPEMFGFTTGTFPANATFYVRTLQDYALGQANWSSVGADVLEGGIGEYNQYGRTDTMVDVTMTPGMVTGASGAMGSGGGGGNSNIWQGVKPIAIIGEPVAPMISVIGFGDSIMQGYGGPAGPYPNTQVGGYFANGLFNVNGHHIPWSNIASYASLGTGWDGTAARPRELFKYATHVISEHGSNDKVNSVADATLLAALQRNLLDAKSRGLCRHATQHLITYRTSSTDNWATIANQSVSLNPSGLNGLISAAKGKGIIDDVIDMPTSWTQAPAPFTATDGTKFPVINGVALSGCDNAGTHPSQNLGRHVMAAPYRAWAVSRLMERVTQRPSNLVPPSIIGPKVQGCTLLCLPGTWALGEFAYQTLTYQWYRVVSGTSTAISGATSSTYTLQAADVGNQVSCLVIATNPINSSQAISGNTPTITATGALPTFPATGVVAGGSSADGTGGRPAAGLSYSTGQSDPTGGTGASKIAFSATSGTHVTLLNSAPIVDGQRYTASIIAKAAEYSVLYLLLNSAFTGLTYTFDLTNGVVDANLDGSQIQHVADQVGIIPLGNGWFRCFVTFTAIGDRNDNSVMRWGVSSALGSINGNGAVGSGLYVFRAQIAQGAIDA